MPLGIPFVQIVMIPGSWHAAPRTVSSFTLMSAALRSRSSFPTVLIA
jgi:hypothetical protein